MAAGDRAAGHSDPSREYGLNVCCARAAPMLPASGAGDQVPAHFDPSSQWELGAELASEEKLPRRLSPLGVDTLLLTPSISSAMLARLLVRLRDDGSPRRPLREACMPYT